jgi:hypothetical protein
MKQSSSSATAAALAGDPEGWGTQLAANRLWNLKPETV